MKELVQARSQIQLVKAKLLVFLKILRNRVLECEPVLDVSVVVLFPTPPQGAGYLLQVLRILEERIAVIGKGQ
ncbi:MAG: hypothetical protein ABR881_10840 [Candidatus Sulfotelmatobacter sp.]|jgi:hypothetical protein